MGAVCVRQGIPLATAWIWVSSLERLLVSAAEVVSILLDAIGTLGAVEAFSYITNERINKFCALLWNRLFRLLCK